MCNTCNPAVNFRHWLSLVALAAHDVVQHLDWRHTFCEVEGVSHCSAISQVTQVCGLECHDFSFDMGINELTPHFSPSLSLITWWVCCTVVFFTCASAYLHRSAYASWTCMKLCLKCHKLTETLFFSNYYITQISQQPNCLCSFTLKTFKWRQFTWRCAAI